MLSEDNLFPRFIRKVDRAGRSPYIGVLTIAVLSLIHILRTVEDTFAMKDFINAESPRSAVVCGLSLIHI